MLARRRSSQLGRTRSWQSHGRLRPAAASVLRLAAVGPPRKCAQYRRCVPGKYECMTAMFQSRVLNMCKATSAFRSDNHPCSLAPLCEGDGRRREPQPERWCSSVAGSSAISSVTTNDHLVHQPCRSAVYGRIRGRHRPLWRQPNTSAVRKDLHVKHQFNASLHVPLHC